MLEGGVGLYVLWALVFVWGTGPWVMAFMFWRLARVLNGQALDRALEKYRKRFKDVGLDLDLRQTTALPPVRMP